MARSSFVLVVLLGLSMRACANPIAIPTVVNQVPPLQPRASPPPGKGCAFQGNPDLYGLGIRLGVYLQLLSTLLANAVLSEEYREDARNTNAIIMIAVFAGMVLTTANNQLNATEIFVMSTLLNAFLWSDFTPTHISSYVLFHGGDEEHKDVSSRKKRSRNHARIEEKSSIKSGKEKEKGEMIEMKGYGAAIARSAFGTAIAGYNLWFWFYSQHTLLKNGIDDPDCTPLVFLQTQIKLGTDQTMLYIIVSVMNALVEGVFAAWWLFILTPGTLRFLCEIIKITALSWMRIRRYKQGAVKEKLLEWYLEFGRLDASKLKKFERFRLSRKNTERVRKLRLYMANATVVVTWLGLPAGYTVIVYTALAVELTLAWNNVTNVYILGSTGQLIPFVVGVLGLLQNLYLVTKQLSERAYRRREVKRQRTNITVDWDTGTYVYGLGKDKELKLEASRPARRRSIDSGVHMSIGEKWKDGSSTSFGQMSPTSLRSYTWKS